MIELEEETVNVSDVYTVEIASELPDTKIDVTKSITAQVEPENYVLVSGGMYSGGLNGKAPAWILDAVNQELTTGEGNLTQVLNDLKLLVDDLALGVDQNISQIESTNLSVSSLETSVNSKIDSNQASILDIVATKVTDTEAQAISTNVLNTRFNNNVDAYIANLASAYTSPTSATAINISTLQTSYNDQTARIDGIEYATTDEFGYSLGASKLGTAPDGSIVGWEFTDGTGVQSEFKIQAQNFSISDGVTGKVPFSIVTNPDLTTDISFNGVVSFSNVTEVPQLGSTPQEVVTEINAGNTTTIDGGKITTGTVLSNAFYGNVIYNLVGGVPATEATYTMKISLAAGYIHIR